MNTQPTPMLLDRQRALAQGMIVRDDIHTTIARHIDIVRANGVFDITVFDASAWGVRRQKEAATRLRQLGYDIGHRVSDGRILIAV